MRVAICIGTFRRPQLLHELLDAISHLTFTKVLAPEISVVVVDNDPEGSARGICEQAKLPWPVKYSIEPRRGISFVRNRTIAEAGDVDFVATIDDDEAPVAAWLDELLWTQAQFRADIVNGPVPPRFDPDVADWVKRGRFFEHRNYPTGTEVKFCYTGNSLIRAAVFSDVPLFDHSFALTGGEDTLFFLRARQAGYKIVWSRDAIAYESISTARANVPWILRRQYQLGNTWTFCESSLANNLRTRLMRFAKAGCLLALGGVWVLPSLVFGKVAIVRSLRPFYRGLGMLSALTGSRYFAYHARHTSPAVPHLHGGSPALSKPIVE
jgi:succinoglycan biosynthesis protein ExoM